MSYQSLIQKAIKTYKKTLNLVSIKKKVATLSRSVFCVEFPSLKHNDYVINCQIIITIPFLKEKLLVNLKDKEKREILNLLASISQTFSPCWDEYPPYKTLQERATNLKKILNKPSDANFIRKLYQYIVSLVSVKWLVFYI